MSKYLVYQVGCIECGVSSYAVSKHDKLEDAVEAAKAHPSTWDSEGGDGYVSVINLDTLKEEFEE